ncbi:MAG: hypothetical protein KIG72_00560 [Bradymonadales bacterium]|nr:hypothetical protein [Bradymonadales bacterium]
MLTTEERLLAVQFNLRARQLFWRGLLPENHEAFGLDGDALVDWVLAFQAANDLAQDGCLGPSTLLTIAALARGGVGGAIVGGREVAIDGVRVARMFVPGDEVAVVPDVCCVLSMPEIAKTTRERLAGNAKKRVHFSIDSSKGCRECSLIVQWADPLRAVPFCPERETDDYPRGRQCVGVEVENFLMLYQIDADERHWRRRRPMVKATIQHKVVSQPVLYRAQVRALDALLDMFARELGIPKVFPMKDGEYDNSLLDGDVLDGFRGCLARYNYISVNNEPGAGFAASLETIFGEIDRKSEKKSEAARPVVPMFDSSQFDEARRSLAEHPEPTATFGIAHEVDAPFNLSDAIAAAYSTGRGARAARLAERCKKFDDSL